jgi:hypothetical protein
MCTVSFLPSPQGFYLAMNRDEKRDRFAALPPEVVEFENHRVLFPREPNGGTWISANDAGVCLALINWHRIKREPNNGVRSRGEVIRKLVGISTSDEISTAVKKLPLRKLRPFRLIAILPSERHIIEWRWNLEWLTMRNHEWQRQHWFSSGLDEERAELERAKVCASFVAGGGLSAVALAKADVPGSKTAPAGVNAAGYSLSALRRLHRSHAPNRGPFSICMHRPDAATVSYTEISVQNRHVIMRYRPGPACAKAPLVATSIERAL